ncbi:MAG TPA: prepilin-type N-terminal cleavage/methylation domain-containing protein [Kofleriaceae bacterium]
MKVKKKTQRGLTLLEVMIALAIMAMMMALAWTTIRNTQEARTSVESFEERNHELRAAMSRVVADFECAYLSRNEDMTQAHPRTMMIVKPEEPIPSVRFSTLCHRVLWADAKESEQTVIEYLPFADKDNGNKTNWVRREQRRESNQPPELEPSEYDVLVTDVQQVKIELFNWKTLEWVDNWNTTQSDGQRGMLPYRVRITVTVKGPDDKNVKLSTEARILMQEALNFSPT